jgi:hypothetical protein
MRSPRSSLRDPTWAHAAAGQQMAVEDVVDVVAKTSTAS